MTMLLDLDNHVSITSPPPYFVFLRAFLNFYVIYIGYLLHFYKQPMYYIFASKKMFWSGQHSVRKFILLTINLKKSISLHELGLLN
jgi:hypothetical protein